MTQSHEREFCEQVLRRAASEYGMNIQALEVDEDHVHVYIDIPPQRSVGRAVAILKSVSARLMFKRFSYFRRKLWAGEFWGDSYFVRTVGEGVTAARRFRFVVDRPASVSRLRAEAIKLMGGSESKLRAGTLRFSEENLHS
jgi:putative transposase